MLFVYSTAIIGWICAVVKADYECLCNYHVERAIYPSVSTEDTPIGYLYEFDCKPTYKISTPNWQTIQYEKQVGYIARDTQIKIQTCPGDPDTEDIVTATIGTTNKPSSQPDSRTTTPTYTISTKIQMLDLSTKKLANISTFSTSRDMLELSTKEMKTTPVVDSITTITNTHVQYTTTPNPIKTNPTTTSSDTASIYASQASTTEATRITETAFPTSVSSSTPSTTTVRASASSSATSLSTSAVSSLSLLPSSMTSRTNTPSTFTTSSTSAVSVFATTLKTTQVSKTALPAAVSTNKTSTFVYTSVPRISVSSTEPSTAHKTQAATTTRSPECPPYLTRSQFLKEFGSHCYEFVLGRARQWQEAEDDCRDKAGHLVTIRNSDEQNFIYNTLVSLNFHGDNGVWIGLTDKDREGHWRWSSGERVTFTSWAPHEPGLLYLIEDCALFDMRHHGHWGDYKCKGILFNHQSHGWICEYKKQ